MRFNISGQEPRFRKMARVLDLKSDDGEAVVEHLFTLNKKTNLPIKLNGIGVKPEHIETLADLAFDDFCHLNNPKPVTRENFKNLYLEAL